VRDTLSSLGQGLANPVHGTQQAFRALLSAMSHPGRVMALPEAALAGVQPPGTQHAQHPFGIAMTVALLSLLDPEAPLHLHGPLHSAAAAAYFRFHCGAALAGAAQAPLVAARAADLTPALWCELSQGSDDAPQLGATLLVEVAGLDEQQPLPGAALLGLRGPGIATVQTLAVQGLPAGFWPWRQGLQQALPRGVELFLCCGTRVAAIPRTTHLSLET
jgi:alpha-D-ribose 1-methylphosphonate 5-triphosphate synthase subunit PhnH